MSRLLKRQHSLSNSSLYLWNTMPAVRSCSVNVGLNEVVSYDTLARPILCNSVLFLMEERGSPFKYYRHSSKAHKHYLRDLVFLLSSPLMMLNHTAFPGFFGQWRMQMHFLCLGWLVIYVCGPSILGAVGWYLQK